MLRKDVVAWNQPIPGISSDIKIEIESALIENEFLSSMLPIDDAVDAVNSLKKGGATIVIATARPAVCDAYTLAWLRKHRIPFDEFVNTSYQGKGAVVADCLIDDYQGNLKAFHKPGRQGILFDQPWNRKPDPPIEWRIGHGWRGTLKVLSELQLAT